MAVLDLGDFAGAATAEPAAEAATKLAGLARFWLSDQAKAALGDHHLFGPYSRLRPNVPTERGACWIVCVNHDERTHGLLRRAMLVPLLWRENCQHDRRLPKQVQDVADEVLCHVRDQSDSPMSLYGLQLYDASGVAAPDLSGLTRRQLDPSSGWVSLAAGLLVAAVGGQPNAEVWATGSWSAEGVGNVDHKGLLAKLHLALQHHVRQFFVPEEQGQEARQYLQSQGTNVQVGVLRQGTAVVREALGDYTATLLVRPAKDAQRHEKCTYHDCLHRLWPEASGRYYEEDLVPEIITMCRDQAAWGDEPPTHLVTIASASGEATLLTAEVVSPEKILVLYTHDDDGRKFAKSVRDLLTDASRRWSVMEKPVCYGQPMIVEMEEAVREFVQGVPPQRVAFDMTPGKFLMKLALLDHVAGPESILLHLDHDYDAKMRMARPFSQRVLTWKRGHAWQFPKASKPP